LSHRQNLKWSFSKKDREGYVASHDDLASADFPQEELEADNEPGGVDALPNNTDPAIVEELRQHERLLIERGWDGPSFIRLAAAMRDYGAETGDNVFLCLVGIETAVMQPVIKEGTRWVPRFEVPPPVSVPEPAPPAQDACRES